MARKTYFKRFMKNGGKAAYLQDGPRIPIATHNGMTLDEFLERYPDEEAFEREHSLHAANDTDFYDVDIPAFNRNELIGDNWKMTPEEMDWLTPDDLLYVARATGMDDYGKPEPPIYDDPNRIIRRDPTDALYYYADFLVNNVKNYNKISDFVSDFFDNFGGPLAFDWIFKLLDRATSTKYNPNITPKRFKYKL